MSSIEGLEIYGPPKERRAGVITFNLVISTHMMLLQSRYRRCCKSGHHCAQPLMKWLNVSSTARASFYVYNTKEDVDQLVEALKQTKEFSLMNFNNLDQLYRSVIMDHYKNPRNKGVLDNGSMTVDMNNPTCGDRIRLTFDIENGIINDAKFEGEGCSISMSSASMMTEAVKGHSLGEAMQMSQEFTKMMLGEDYEITEEMGDIEALQGVSQFPDASSVQH